MNNAADLLLDHSKLWKVNDDFLEVPEEKFTKRTSPIVEITTETWECSQFDYVIQQGKLPRDLLEFVDGFVSELRISCSEFSSVRDACNEVIRRIEYSEPYFFLVDTLVQLEYDASLITYQHRVTKDILDPTRMEVFKYQPGWDFKPYKVIQNMMEHEGMRHFLRNNVIPPQFKDREAAMKHILSKMSEVVWGSFGWLENFVDEMLNDHLECFIYEDRRVKDVYDRTRVQDGLAGDYLFWLACTLGVMTWFKSPRALPFLARYHIIYSSLFDVGDNGKLIPDVKTGGEAIVDGCSIYTLADLEKLPNQAPDTCVLCGIATHCSKHVNVTALRHPLCSCGDVINPLHSGNHAYDHYSMACEAYRRVHPPRSGYVCQRCMFNAVNNLGDGFACGRAICPAVKCPHHPGQAARLRALTQQRTKQLTAAPMA